MTFKDKTFELIGKDHTIFNDLIKYVELIEETNKVLNLTGFTGDALWHEGIYQSLVLMIKSFPKTDDKKMLDIGAGAGFPSVPFLIYKRDFSLYISEPSKKRVDFLQKVNEELNLNIRFINERIEDYKEEEQFNLITARAVTSLKNLIEISSKVGAINAQYSFLKGPKIHDEIAEAKWIMKELSIEPIIDKIEIIDSNSISKTHYLFKYKKVKTTPNQYPRSWLLISSK